MALGPERSPTTPGMAAEAGMGDPDPSDDGGTSPTATFTPDPLPDPATWRPMVQTTFPGIGAAGAANDNGSAEEEEEAPVTMRDPVPYGECFGDWGA